MFILYNAISDWYKRHLLISHPITKQGCLLLAFLTNCNTFFYNFSKLYFFLINSKTFIRVNVAIWQLTKRIAVSRISNQDDLII